jgi:mannose-1-phosphate guanylyltransferase
VPDLVLPPTGTVLSRQALHRDPDLAAAQRFLQNGHTQEQRQVHLAGDRILEKSNAGMPALCDTLLTLDAVLDTPAYMETLQRHWPAVHKETIDYGIMERADRVAVIPVDLGWSDIGAWPAVMALHTTDAHNNVVVGDVIPLDTFDTMIFAHGDRLVATSAINDLITWTRRTPLLIARPDQAQRVRDIVDQLKAGGREDKL